MYRDDDAARGERANALIAEIGDLERKKVEAVATEQRLEAARDELRALQAATTIRASAQGIAPSIATHLFVFAATAGATYLGYTLFLAG